MTTPTQLLVGDKDLRCPPHQSYYYHHSLKERGVPCKLWNYPGSGHSLAATEHCLDAYMNIALWMDEYLMVPYLPKKVEKVVALGEWKNSDKFPTDKAKRDYSLAMMAFRKDREKAEKEVLKEEEAQKE